MPNEQTQPSYVPPIAGVLGEGAILYSSVQGLSDPQKAQARANMGLGSAAVMNAAGAAATANSSQLVRGDDLRWAILANAAQLDAGKLALAQLPDRAVMQSITVANQAARLALTQANAVGRIVYQTDTGVSYALKPSGVPATLADWNAIGGSVSYQSITGLSVFLAGFLASANQAEAKSALGVANVRDQASSPHAIVQGNLVLNGQGAATFTMDASTLPGAFVMRAPYRSVAGDYYPALSPNLDGSLAVVDVTGLPAALTGKANLVAGKVPLSELPAVVGALTSSKTVANKAARLLLTTDAARGYAVIDADTGKTWMLIADGVPSVESDWLQIGDRSVVANEIGDATAAGITLLTAANATAQRAALGLAPTSTVDLHRIAAKRNGSIAGAITIENAGGFSTVILSHPLAAADRTLYVPNSSGTLAITSSASGRISGSADVDGWAGKADLVGGVVPLAQLPPVTGQLTTSRLVANAAARLALTLDNARNAVVVDSDTGKSWMLVDGGVPAVSGDWLQVGDRSIHISELAGAGTFGLSFLSQATVLDAKGLLSISRISDGLAGAMIDGGVTLQNGAHQFQVDVAALASSIVVTPPSGSGQLAVLSQALLARGMNGMRVITSIGGSTILASDFGGVVEVSPGISAIAFSTNPSDYANAIPAFFTLWVKASVITITGNLVDQWGNVLTSLPAGHHRIVAIQNGGAVRFVAENYEYRPLRSSAAEFTATQYTPNATWRSGGNASEIGAHLRGLDDKLAAEFSQAYLKCSHAFEQPFIDGVNTINLVDPTTFAVSAANQASIIGVNVFSPHLSGAWLLELEINARDESSVPDPNSLSLQTWDGTAWATSTPDVETILFSGSGITVTKVTMRTVIIFDVTGAVRRARWVINGIDPPGTIHLDNSSGAQPSVKFLANRL